MDKNNFLIKGFLESPNHPSLKVRMDTAESDFIDFKNELLSDSDDYTPEQLNKMTQYELLDARLQHEGICGYTSDIMRWVTQVFGLGLQSWEIQKLVDWQGDFYD